LSSFVRQLNCYGFHKVKSDPLRIKEAEGSEESKYLRFHHEKFRRGRPDLLSKIRKPNHTEAVEKQEVDELKHEVSMLRKQVSAMSCELEGVKVLL
jgi:polyhydroxyalkanoate synthesis regulator phasin